MEGKVYRALTGRKDTAQQLEQRRFQSIYSSPRLHNASDE